MASTYLTPTQVTRKALVVLHQKLNFISSITRDYDDSYAKPGAKIGDTLKLRLPNQYTVRTGKTLQAQDNNEQSVDLKIDTQAGVDMNFSSADMTLSIDEFSDRYIEPAMAELAAYMEGDALTMYQDVYNQVNNTGSAASYAKLLLARKQLVDNLTPAGDRSICLNTQDNVDLVDGLKALFNDQKSLAKQYTEGYLGRAAGFDFMENTLLPSHTRGAENTGYTTDTRTSALPVVTTSVSTLTVASGTGAGKKGDVFTIAGVFRVHPELKTSTGALQQFVLTADYAGGAGTINISPAIVLSGSRQNVIIPAGSATAGLTFAGTASAAHGISLAYQKGAFAFVTADLVKPQGVDFCARETIEGLSMRIVRQYDINNDNYPTRIDVLYGKKTIRAQLASRLANN